MSTAQNDETNSENMQQASGRGRTQGNDALMFLLNQNKALQESNNENLHMISTMKEADLQHQIDAYKVIQESNKNMCMIYTMKDDELQRQIDALTVENNRLKIKEGNAAS